MKNLTWQQFAVKHQQDPRSVFEDMSRDLFKREHACSQLETYHNHPGIEAEPILDHDKKKWIGFQAKYFENTFDYSEVEESIKIACKYKKNGGYKNLDLIEIYTNKQITKRSKSKQRIEQYASQFSIAIRWVQGKEILSDLLPKPACLNLLQIYFGLGNELGLVAQNVKKEHVDIFASRSHVRLSFVNTNKKQTLSFKGFLVHGRLTKNKLIVVTGSPGSGKSVLFTQLAFNAGGLHKHQLSQMRAHWLKGGLPVLINLKQCRNSSLNEVVREKLDRFLLKQDSSSRYVYILDGLDELSFDRADEILASIMELIKDKSTKKVFISCRTSNQNLTLIQRYLKASEFSMFRIADLSISDIYKYFSGKGDQKKIALLKELKKNNKQFLTELNDVLVVNLLWDEIACLGENITIVDLFEKRIRHLLTSDKHKKNLDKLNLLDEKAEQIININTELSDSLNRNFTFRFSRELVQELLLAGYNRLTYQDSNWIFNYICSQFFSDVGGGLYEYTHRRYQEYFLVKKLKQYFEQDKSQLRKLNIFQNLDLVGNLFIPYLKRSYILADDLPRVIETNYFEMYNNYDFDYSIPFNLEDLIETLSRFSEREFSLLFSNEVVGVKSLLKLSINFRTARILWINDKLSLAKYFFEKYLNRLRSEEKERKKDKHAEDPYWKEWEDYLFCILNIDGASAANIFNKLVRGNYKSFENMVGPISPDEERGKDKLVKGYFRALLRGGGQNVSKLTQLLPKLDEGEFLFLLEVLLDFEFIYLIFKERKFNQAISKKLKSLQSVSIDENNLVLLFFNLVFNLPNKTTTDLSQILQKELKKIIDSDRHFIWRRRAYKYAWMLYIQKNVFDTTPERQEPEVKYYTSLGNYAFLVGKVFDIFLGKPINIKQIIDKFCELHSEDFYAAYNPLDKQVGEAWAYLFFYSKHDELRILKNILFKNLQSLNKYAFYTCLFNLDARLFSKTINEQEILELGKKLDDWSDNYQELADIYLLIARLLSVKNGAESRNYLHKALSIGRIRHGYHKDIIVSYGLLESFKLVLKNDYMPKGELKTLASNIAKLIVKILEVTDGDHTNHAPAYLIEIVAGYDIEWAEELVSYFNKHKSSFYRDNSMLTELLLAKIENGFPYEEITEAFKDYQRQYLYQGRVNSDFYEQQFKVYIALCLSDYYENYEEQTFRAVYGLVQELKEKSEYYFTNDDYQEEILVFKKLCLKYKKRFLLPGKDKKRKDSYHLEKKRIKMRDFISELNSINDKKSLGKLYKKLADYKNDYELDDKEPWFSLYQKTTKIDGSNERVIAFLNKLYFPSSDYYTGISKYLHYLLAALLNDKRNLYKLRREFLFTKGGEMTFKNIIASYGVLEDKQMCINLFKIYYGFCRFLLE